VPSHNQSLCGPAAQHAVIRQPDILQLVAMSPLSSDTIFHFTRSREYLLDILTNELRPHYSLEDFTPVATQSIPSHGHTFAFPLISFCDIPLSQTAAHMQTYGNYAIGLTKAWAISKSVTPLHYYHAQSSTLQAINELIQHQWDQAGEAQGTPIGGTMSRLVCFLKPYEGEFFRPGEPPRHVRFYDEREWRFVPVEAGNTRVLPKAEWLDNTKRAAANTLARQLSHLSFEPKDIRYIIVAHEAEILPICRLIQEIKGKYSQDDVLTLTARIISAEQIRGDF